MSRGFACMLALGATLGCSATAERPKHAGDSCPSDVDGALAAVGMTLPERVDCGSFNAAQSAEVSAGLACFMDAVAAGTAVELTVNRCIDCSISSTYVATEDGELLEVVLEADLFGDELRQTRVSTCVRVGFASEGPPAGPECFGAVEQFACQAPLRAR